MQYYFGILKNVSLKPGAYDDNQASFFHARCRAEMPSLAGEAGTRQ